MTGLALLRATAILAGTVAAAMLLTHRSAATAPRAQTSAVQARPCSLWPATAEPESTETRRDSPVEIGVKFLSDVDGVVSAIRLIR